MPFDAAEVARQIQESKDGSHYDVQARIDALKLARRIYEAVGETEWELRVRDAATRRWVAAPLSCSSNERSMSRAVASVGDRDSRGSRR